MSTLKTLQLIERSPFFFLYADHAAGALHLVWTAATAEMTDDDFNGAMGLLADKAIEVGAANILVDLRAFDHKPSAEAMAWRKQEVVPKYNQVVKRFAFLAGSAGDGPSTGEGETFETQRLASEEAILEWFTS